MRVRLSGKFLFGGIGVCGYQKGTTEDTFWFKRCPQAFEFSFGLRCIILALRGWAEPCLSASRRLCVDKAAAQRYMCELATRWGCAKPWIMCRRFLKTRRIDDFVVSVRMIYHVT